MAACAAFARDRVRPGVCKTRLRQSDRNHFEQVDSKPPADAMSWLKETAQLELFEEDT